MAITIDKDFKEKVELIGKYKSKNAEWEKVYKYGVNINSPKLDDKAREKVISNVNKLYEGLKKAEESKPKKSTSAPKSGAKKKTMLGLASEIMKRDNITWAKARAKAKQEYESDKKKAVREEKQQIAEFKRKVGKIKFVRATTKTDIQKDKVIPALPSGKRYPKRGTTTNAYGTFKNNPKKPYWENRANRMDVNQPSKSVYPKLAEGGQSGKVSSHQVWSELYDLKQEGVRNVSLNGFTESIGYVMGLELDDSEIKKVGEMSYITLYAKGGKFNDNLYFDQLASMSGTRAGAVKEWASSNSLSEIDLLNLMQGMGRGQISRADFSRAIVGDKKANSEIISYAKSGRGFKMAKGGEVSEEEIIDKIQYFRNGIPPKRHKYALRFKGKVYSSNDTGEIVERVMKDLKDNKYAKGGMVEHGLQVGDEIVREARGSNVIEVKAENGKLYLINLNSGKRIPSAEYTMENAEGKHKGFFQMGDGGKMKRIKRTGC